MVEQGEAGDYLGHIRGITVFGVAIEVDDQGGQDE